MNSHNRPMHDRNGMTRHQGDNGGDNRASADGGTQTNGDTSPSNPHQDQQPSETLMHHPSTNDLSVPSVAPLSTPLASAASVPLTSLYGRLPASLSLSFSLSLVVCCLLSAFLLLPLLSVSASLLVHLFLFVSLCLTARLALPLSACLLLPLSHCSSVSSSVCMSASSSVSLLVRLFLCLHVCFFLCLAACLPASLLPISLTDSLHIWLPLVVYLVPSRCFSGSLSLFICLLSTASSMLVSAHLFHRLHQCLCLTASTSICMSARVSLPVSLFQCLSLAVSG